MEQSNCRIVDFHSHILPNVDDGSSSVEMSISMLRIEAEHGINAVVATPHFYADRDTPDRFLARRARAEQSLREEMLRHAGLPDIYLGAEVAFFRGMGESDALQSLCIADSHHILVEMPCVPWTEQMLEELRQIQSRQGLIPILAHIERYLSPLRTRHMVDRLETLPVMLQANGSFFRNKRTAGTAMKLLRNGNIHLLGSDCHDLDGRAPCLGEAVRNVKRCLGNEALVWIAQHQAQILP